MPEPLRRSPGGPATKSIGLPFIELQSVDSTNNYARQQIHAGLAQHGMTVFAHEQLAGKGQRSRSWNSEKGANITMSLVVKEPGLQLSEQFQLSACISVGIQEFFSKYAGPDTKIKWPNDVYWQDRKAGGVLIESVISSGTEVGSLPAGEAGRVVGPQDAARSHIHEENENPTNPWRWAIIGIGININQVKFPAELKNPVSLKQITGLDLEPALLAKELCDTINKWYTELIKNGFEKIYSYYLSNFFKKDSVEKFKKDNIVFKARVDGVSKNGQLIVSHALQEEFEFGEIEWLINS